MRLFATTIASVVDAVILRTFIPYSVSSSNIEMKDKTSRPSPVRVVVEHILLHGASCDHTYRKERKPVLPLVAQL